MCIHCSERGWGYATKRDNLNTNEQIQLLPVDPFVSNVKLDKSLSVIATRAKPDRLLV